MTSYDQFGVKPTNLRFKKTPSYVPVDVRGLKKQLRHCPAEKGESDKSGETGESVVILTH